MRARKFLALAAFGLMLGLLAGGLKHTSARAQCDPAGGPCEPPKGERDKRATPTETRIVRSAETPTATYTATSPTSTAASQSFLLSPPQAPAGPAPKPTPPAHGGGLPYTVVDAVIAIVVVVVIGVPFLRDRGILRKSDKVLGHPTSTGSGQGESLGQHSYIDDDGLSDTWEDGHSIDYDENGALTGDGPSGDSAPPTDSIWPRKPPDAA